MKNNIILIFLFVTIFGIVGIIYLQYQDKKFYSNDLDSAILDEISTKEKEIQSLIKKHYGIDFQVPIIISDKLGIKLFGMAIFNPLDKSIKLYLSKSRFKESAKYMLQPIYSDRLPEEFGQF